MFLDADIVKGGINLVKNKQFVRLIMRKSLEALWYLNFNKLIHRDIKPANIMIDRDCNFKLRD
jgi:serine/threonine protein kinase